MRLLFNKILVYEDMFCHEHQSWSYTMTSQCQVFMLFAVEPNKISEDNKNTTHKTQGKM